jgi:hypothetical protein
MADATAALAELIATARGERPQSLACREAEEVLNIALALLVELAVSNDRIDRLERLVAELSGRSVEDVREIRYESEIAKERQAATDALLTRALRIMVDPRAQPKSPVSHRS